MQATWFIEAIKSQNWPRQINLPLQDIKKLEKNLKSTRESSELKTIAVFKIKPKSQEVIDNYERMLKEKSGAVN